MKIVVVCGAGASSTFVALKLRTAAAARGLPADIVAGSASQLDALGRVDVLLVGAHLVAALPGIQAWATENGATVAVLPAVSPATLDGDAALDLALTTHRDTDTMEEADGTPPTNLKETTHG